jgi:hypothetical protein
MNATLASLVGRSCVDVSPQSLWPTQRRIHCPEDVQLQVTIPLSEAGVSLFLAAPRTARLAGRAASNATGLNCTCGAHGTLGASSGGGTCNCVCASGWTTDPSQVR